MSWSKVSKEHKKPLMWWYHKIMCEFWWHLVYNGKYLQRYYSHLNKLCKYGFNLYGEQIK